MDTSSAIIEQIQNFLLEGFRSQHHTLDNRLNAILEAQQNTARETEKMLKAFSNRLDILERKITIEKHESRVKESAGEDGQMAPTLQFGSEDLLTLYDSLLTAIETAKQLNFEKNDAIERVKHAELEMHKQMLFQAQQSYFDSKKEVNRLRAELTKQQASNQIAQNVVSQSSSVASIELILGDISFKQKQVVERMAELQRSQQKLEQSNKHCWEKMFDERHSLSERALFELMSSLQKAHEPPPEVPPELHERERERWSGDGDQPKAGKRYQVTTPYKVIGPINELHPRSQFLGLKTKTPANEKRSEDRRSSPPHRQSPSSGSNPTLHRWAHTYANGHESPPLPPPTTLHPSMSQIVRSRGPEPMSAPI